jgi:diguanylate cyclase (GGDEF)-like protein
MSIGVSMGVGLMTRGTAFSVRRVCVLLAVPVTLIAGAVFVTANVQRNAALLGAREQEASLRMLGAISGQEAAARGFFQTREQKFLRPWDPGTTAFASSLAELRSLVAGDVALRRSLADLARRASAWHAVTRAEILTLERSGRLPAHGKVEQAREQMEGFRAAHVAFDASLGKADDHRLTMATLVSVAVAAALAAMLVAVGLLLAHRMARREAARHRDQAQLRELLQASESEQESRTLLIRHLQMLVPDADPAVLTHSQEHDRLEITTANPTDALALRASREHLPMRSCMAIRLGRSYDRRPDDESLLRCEICGAVDATSACEPLFVGGKTIGSVLLSSQKEIKAALRERVRDTVVQVAPIFANQRNLILAETLARSDSLTGLSNRRAADEAFQRMIAHAARSSTPVAVVLLDLDGLKQLNDRHGHEGGDSALALLGRIISSTIRASDFAARTGGDEFMIILPDTDRDGAIIVAEKLRAEIERVEVAGVGRISASLGVAVLPADAADADDLLRKADRALYAAKKQGRNCVGAFARSPDDPPGEPSEAGTPGAWLIR